MGKKSRAAFCEELVQVITGTTNVWQQDLSLLLHSAGILPWQSFSGLAYACLHCSRHGDDWLCS